MEEKTELKVIDRRIPEDVKELTPQAKTPAVKQDDQFLATIERLSRQPNIPVEKIEQIMNMQFRILDREAEQAFNAAMTRAQNKIELVIAKSHNIQTGSNYANLRAVLLSAKPIYTAEGFSLMFYEGETPKEGHKKVCVDIMHEQGHTKQRYVNVAIQTTGIAGKSMMTQIHGEGSAFSYGRRYLTCMIFNIPTGDDDDGNAAGGPAYIDEKQLSTIVDMINSKSVDEAAFLKYMKAESSETILAKDYNKAIVALNKAKGAQAAREPGEEG